MRTQYGRAQVGVQQRRDDFVAVVERLLPMAGSQLERMALYLVISAFWGLILFTAATFALPQ